MIYLLVFFVSILLLYFGLNNNNKKIGKFLIFSGLLFPCIIAGLRNHTVGSDTGGYVLNLYKFARKSTSFNNLLDVSTSIYNSKDIAYLYITYLFGKYNLSFQFMLFLYEILIIFPIYFALKKVKKSNDDIIFGMMLFYLTMYNLSMNMVRQSIAISFVLLSFSFFIKKSRKRDILLSLLFFIIAIEFHDTALYIFPIYLIYLLLNSKKVKEKDKSMIVGIIIVTSTIMVLFYKPILTFIGNSGIYPKVIWYLNRNNSFNIDYTRTLLNIFIVSVIIYKKEFFSKNNVNYKFGLSIAFLNLIINFLGSFITYADRIAYYLFYILIANYLAILNKKNTNSKHLSICILIVFIAYWVIVILINNGSHTLPYKMFR